MYAEGIDDGQIGARLARLDDELARAVADGTPTVMLVRERQELLLQLADLALEVDAPLPGADAEYLAARAAQAALARHDATMDGRPVAV